MKKTITLSFLCIICILIKSVNAAVLTVSNIPNGPGQYSSLGAAQTGANNDDTLLIHGTALNYGDFTLTKRLVLIGAGYYQNNVITNNYSFINNLRFNKTANGAKVFGIYSYYIACTGNSTDTINNILIEECLIGQLIDNYSSTINNYIPWTNITIRNCHFDRNADGGTNNPDMSFIFSYTNANIRIENCIFDGYVNGKGLIFNHCLFLMASVGQPTFHTVTNSLIENCMFIRANNGPTFFDYANSINNTFNNNLTFRGSGDALPYAGCNGDSNLVLIDPKFVTASHTSFFNISSDYHLQTISPAKNAATDGTDIGVYGGVNGFSTVLEPLMTPIIRQFTINNPTVTPGGTLNINVQVTKPLAQ